MIYMRFTGINYYKLAVEKDRDSIFTTITTIWKQGLIFVFLFSSRLLLFSGLLSLPLRCLLPLDPSQHSMRTHDHGQYLKKYCIIQQDT